MSERKSQKAMKTTIDNLGPAPKRMKVSDLIRVEENQKQEEMPPLYYEKTINLPIWDEVTIKIPPKKFPVKMHQIESRTSSMCDESPKSRNMQISKAFSHNRDKLSQLSQLTHFSVHSSNNSVVERKPHYLDPINRKLKNDSKELIKPSRKETGYFPGS